jgi:hypothetical protein
MKKRLDRTFGTDDWRNSSAVRRHAVDTLTDIMMDSWRVRGTPYVAVVREWATERGWPQEDIDEFAIIAETVQQALRRAGVITR